MGISVVVALFAGCGSGNSNAGTTDGSARPLTKAQFLQQANRICQKGVKEKEEALTGAAKLAAGSGRAPSSKDLEKVIAVAIVPNYSQIIEQLGELSPPPSDAGQVERLVREYRTALKDVEAEPGKAAEVSPFEHADKAARAMGLDTCSL